MLPTHIDTWQMTAPGTLERTRVPLPTPQPGEAVVRIAGCGVCHTDLSYFYHGVPTVQKPPLTLGHEISGVVVGGNGVEALVGAEVVVPAVIPCGACELCLGGRGNRCLGQKMPGNSMGIYGGFASHIVADARFLCPVPARGAIPLEHLAVVADAVTTPYQAACRADLRPGDRVVVIGAAGGVGSFMVQTAKAMGAAAVVGIDLNEAKLQTMTAYGADLVLNPRGRTPKDLRELIKMWARERGLPPNTGWKIFEVTGSKPGQELALALLSFVGKLVVVGYGTEETSYMLSKLMAFDAEIIGTWGCPPERYGKVLEMCIDGRIALAPFVETRPMSRIGETFEQAHHGQLDRRAILTPDFQVPGEGF